MSETVSEQLNNEKKATINTVQHAAYVARLAIPIYYNYSWFIPYDSDNLYPNKIKTIAERSVSTSTAIETHSDFLSGLGFGDDLNKIIVNDEGQTLNDMLKEKCADYSTYKGVALHFNYNRAGQIAEIQEIPFEGLRWLKDMSKLVYCRDWHRWGGTKHKRYHTEYNLFNPEKAIEEMNEAGIDKYNGQILYFIKKKSDIYTICRFDSAVNSSQFEDEATIHQLSSVQNDYALGGVFKYPQHLYDEYDKKGIVGNLKANNKGAKSAGGWIMVPLQNEEQMKAKLFEPMVRQNIDGFFKTQNEQAKSNIYEVYQQPPILNGKSFGGMFNQDSFVDAFDYYNSKTQNERDIIQSVFNKFWGFTVWSKGETLEIEPKEYIITRNANASGSIESDDPLEAEKEALKIKQEAQAKLKGTASGTESLLKIQESIAAGVTTYKAALKMLDEIFGFSEDVAREILGAEKEIKKNPEK